MIINHSPSNNVNAIASYVPLGQQPVGQENSDLKASSFKALEQTASSVRNENRRSANNQPSDSPSKNVQVDRQAAQQEQLIKDQAKINALSARDREVRAHEQAHAAVGGQYAGSPTYEFVKGPDGVNYAVAGEVSISTGSVPNDPEATIQKARQIRAAANAPADASGQDRAVAAAASSLEAEARAELSIKQAAEIQEKEQAAEQQVKAQKAEDAKKIAEQEEFRKEQKLQLAKQEEDATRTRAERIDGLTKTNSKTVDINRHLVEIGAVKGSQSIGNFLNQQV